MLQTRVIPVLLLKGNGLYKGVNFKNHKYIGDPINTVKIFNEKEVDEVILLDITASLEKKTINYELLKDITNEAFMPFAYGGGICNIDDVEKLFKTGIEKIVLNTSAIKKPKFVKEVAANFGSQSIVVSLDIKRNLFGTYKVYGESGTKKNTI